MRVAVKVVFVTPGFTARKNPDVCVGDLLSDNSREYPVGAKRLALGLRDFCNRLKIFADLRHVPHPANVLFGYNLYVSWRLWMYINKGEEPVVFVYFAHRDVASDHFAENAVFHTKQVY